MAGGTKVASGAVPTDWDVFVMLVWLSVARTELGEEVFGCSILSNPEIGFALVRALRKSRTRIGLHGGATTGFTEALGSPRTDTAFGVQAKVRGEED